jgi:hypothetical protein
MEDVWRPSMGLTTTEESVLADKVEDGNEGVEKIAGKLHIRKLGTFGRTTLADGTGTAAVGTGLTYQGQDETETTVVPKTVYTALEINKNVFSRMILNPRNGFRTQLAASLAEGQDAEVAALASSFANYLGGAQDLDKGLLLACLGGFATRAKKMFKVGVTVADLVIHPSQIQFLLDIPEITNAQIRGDDQNPNVKGWVWTAWNLRLNETGNVLQSGGLTYNPLFLRPAMVLGYNQKPDFLVQEYELVERIIAWMELGAGLVWDQYCMAVLTNG